MSRSLPTPKLAIFLFASCVLCRSFAIDQLSPNENISFGEELVSSGAKFTLGFFSPKTTTNKYVGIWYNNIKPQTIVWVANRHNPIISSMTASLTVSANGTLAITASNSSSIILFLASTPISNPIAQLLDTGNFIVRNSKINNDGNYSWQSFDYPTDTLLPSMKLGWNLRMSTSRNLTSWKSELDPSQGSHSLAIDIRGGHEVTQFDGNRTVWRSGMWNGIEFSGIPDFNAYGDFILTFVSNSEEICFNYHMANPSTLARIVVTHSGITERYIWINSSGEWNLVWSTPSNTCDKYNVCGVNAKCNPISFPVCECFPGFEPNSPAEWGLRDSSEGCVRKTRMDCTNGTDQFVKMSNVILPDTVGAKIDGGMHHDECRHSCLSNCSCTGFANYDVRSGGSGCVMYVFDINDVGDLGKDGQDFYLRLAAADIGMKSSFIDDFRKRRQSSDILARPKKKIKQVPPQPQKSHGQHLTSSHPSYEQLPEQRAWLDDYEQSAEDEARQPREEPQRRRRRSGDDPLTEVPQKRAPGYVPPYPTQAELQTIMSRPREILDVERKLGCPSPPLSHRFGDWDLRGLNFDVDVHPTDRRDMTEMVAKARGFLDDIGKTVDQRLKAWEQFCYDFQNLNTKRIESIKTLEDEKAQLIQVVKAQDTKISVLERGSRVNELEFEIEMLRKELEDAKNTEVELNKRADDAVKAQEEAEAQLALSRRTVSVCESEIASLRDKLEVETAKSSSLEKEKQESLNQARRIKEEDEATFLEFYVCSVMYGGSLSF